MRSRWVILVVIGLALLLAACSGDHAAEPTISSIDFTPRLVISIDDTGFSTTKEATENPAITAEPPSAPEGTVVEIRNTGTSDHRVTDDATIDTGILQPGDTTTVVLTTAGDIELHDTANGSTLTVAVTARQG